MNTNHARILIGLLIFAAAVAAAPLARGQAWGLPALSKETLACLECHRQDNAGIYQQWGASKHYRANVGCFECHMAAENDPDGYGHEGQRIATIVSPKDCARCHSAETEEFAQSHHSKGARILGSLDNTLAEGVEGNRGMRTTAYTEGVSAAAVNGCWQCHGYPDYCRSALFPFISCNRNCCRLCLWYGWLTQFRPA